MCVALSAFGIAAAPAPAARAASKPASLCIPLLMDCSAKPTPTPTPSPSSPGSPLGGLGGVVGGILGGATGGATGATAANAKADKHAPTFTLPAAQLGGSSLSIQGLHSVGLVTVPLANGHRTVVIKIDADDVAIDGFVLDVRKQTGPTAVTNASRMELRGNVQVYLNSVSATLLNGLGLSIGTSTTPIPGNELSHELLRPTLGLVGVTANSITFTNNDLNIQPGAS